MKSRKKIDALFLEGQRFTQSPLRITYQFFPASSEPGVQAGFTATKKNFGKAVDRNRLKRLMREAYRLQKAGLTELVHQKKLNALVFFMYTDKTIASFSVMKDAMARAISKLEKIALQAHENPA